VYKAYAMMISRRKNVLREQDYKGTREAVTVQQWRKAQKE
jgi:hypothetical protein